MGLSLVSLSSLSPGLEALSGALSTGCFGEVRSQSARCTFTGLGFAAQTAPDGLRPTLSMKMSSTSSNSAPSVPSPNPSTLRDVETSDTDASPVSDNLSQSASTELFLTASSHESPSDADSHSPSSGNDSGLDAAEGSPHQTAPPLGESLPGERGRPVVTAVLDHPASSPTQFEAVASSPTPDGEGALAPPVVPAAPVLEPAVSESACGASPPETPNQAPAEGLVAQELPEPQAGVPQDRAPGVPQGEASPHPPPASEVPLIPLTDTSGNLPPRLALPAALMSMLRNDLRRAGLAADAAEVATNADESVIVRLF